MKTKLATLQIDVPYKRAGNVIHQQPVAFDLFDNDDHYELVPLLSEEERRVANLPEALKFVIENGKPVSLHGKKDGNFHVIEDACKAMRQSDQPQFTTSG